VIKLELRRSGVAREINPEVSIALMKKQKRLKSLRGLRGGRSHKSKRRQLKRLFPFVPGVAQHIGGEPAGRWGKRGTKGLRGLRVKEDSYLGYLYLSHRLRSTQALRLLF